MKNENVATEVDLVRTVLCAHQTAYAKAHNGEGRGVMESENIAIGYASVELAKRLAELPTARAYYHKVIDHVTEMRKLDLQRANDPAQRGLREYYLGRAHRCDDILFWLGHIEAKIPAGAIASAG